MQRRIRTQRSRTARAPALYAGAYDFEAADGPDLADAAAGPDAPDGADASDAPEGYPPDAAVDGPDAGEPEPGNDDGAAAPPPPAWQTPDGYVLNLQPQILDRLILRGGVPAPRPGHRPRLPGRRRWLPARRVLHRPPRPARRALLRRIGQLARGARRIGALRHRSSGRRFPVFQARSRGRKYRIVARPRGARRFEIMLIGSDDRELSQELGQQLQEEQTRRPAPRPAARPAARPAPRSGATTVRRHPRLGVVLSVPRSTATGTRGELETEMEFEVTLPEDSRGPVLDTSVVPNRWICWLELNFGPDPAAPGNDYIARGTGTLIGARHVLTAGHNLFDEIAPGVRRRVQSVRVSPGFNCQAKRGDVFGMARSARTCVAQEWRDSLDMQHDYGLITLRTPIGESRPTALGGRQLGWWGSPTTGENTRINPMDPAQLARHRVNISGYPGDKCCLRALNPANPCRPILWATAQFRSFGRVTNAAPAAANRLVLYDLDTFGGHSGSPLWVTWRDPASRKTYRNLVAIHTGPAWPVDPALAGLANRGVRITADVMNRVRGWMRLRANQACP